MFLCLCVWKVFSSWFQPISDYLLPVQLTNSRNGWTSLRIQYLPHLLHHHHSHRLLPIPSGKSFGKTALTRSYSLADTWFFFVMFLQKRKEKIKITGLAGQGCGSMQWSGPTILVSYLMCYMDSSTSIGVLDTTKRWLSGVPQSSMCTPSQLNDNKGRKWG